MKNSIHLILKQLELEHQNIRNSMLDIQNQIKNFPNLDITIKIQELISYIHEHHHLEEESLFPLIADKLWLNQGGPRCGFFMGQIIDLKIHERFTSTLKKHNHSAIRTHRTWVSPHNPLWVPLDEHDMGVAFTKAIAQQLDASGIPQNNPVLIELIQGYFDLIDIHSRKEDECLFVLIKKKLDIEN